MWCLLPLEYKFLPMLAPRVGVNVGFGGDLDLVGSSLLQMGWRQRLCKGSLASAGSPHVLGSDAP